MRLAAVVGTSVAALALGTLGGVAATAQPHRTAATEAPPAGELVGHASSACVDDGQSGPRVQLVVVTQEGDTSYSPALVARIREQAARTDDALAASTPSPGTARRVRWATDAQCAPTVSHRTIPTHDYFSDPGALDTALAALDLTRDDRRYAVFLPWSSLPGTEGWCSQAPVGTGTTDPGPARLVVSCYSDDGRTTPTRLAHALVHVLGAVQPDAPHATSDGHCTTAGDLMCVRDGDGAGSTGADSCVPDRPMLLDCGHDDYYSTATPAPRSYLATHWNVADSVFLTTGPSIAPNTLTGLSIDGPTSIPAGTPVTLTARVTDSVDRPGLRYSWDVANGGQCRVLGASDGPSIQVVCETGSALRMSVGVDRLDQYGLRTGYLAAVTEPAAPTIDAVLPSPASVPAGLPLELRVRSTFGPGGGTHRWRAPDGCTITPSGTQQAQARLLCAVGTAGSVRTVQVTAVQADGRTASAEAPVTLTAAPAFTRPTTTRGPWGTVALSSTLRLPGGAPVVGLPVTWWGQRKGAPPVLLARGVTTSDGTASVVTHPRGQMRVWVAGEAPGLVSDGVDARSAARATRRARPPHARPVHRARHDRAGPAHRGHPAEHHRAQPGKRTAPESGA
ncbi:hypothetical protein [Nocardioides marmoribigeumensis]|uniref:Ig-like domain-containing protein n=1 Tax=Nocardioides marmoribigeumensis TaxID=433649 RepID=A0ABU2BZ91_9ACTN|nr:hypothetical protein [Nocardioides marmoribigeumensis]MDR7363713.1 hypothetical protein [Nocardioides marmoribigeumensis]